jgi:nonribosomal peptide synthetase
VLAGIWQELLGVERVGRHDNFFDLGGHSLLVMSMHERLRKRGIDLSISQIFYSPTLKDLSVSFVEERGRYMISDCLVVMREGEGTPLFLVHDGSGDVLSYIELVGLLSGNSPVFGIRAMGLDFETGVLDTIESMASEYIKSIKKVYEKGAFRFAGWSVGGIIAYEMARQLSSSGESVEFVVMIDSYLLGYLSDVAEGLSARSAALYLLGFVNKSLDKTVTERIENMKDVDDVFRECYNLGFKSLGMSMEDMMKAVKMLCSMGKTVHAYRPGGFDGNHYILLADQLSVRDNGGVSDELKMRGWGQGGCRMPKAIKIGGDHQSIMKPPYIQRVAKNINKFMQ